MMRVWTSNPPITEQTSTAWARQKRVKLCNLFASVRCNKESIHGVLLIKVSLLIDDDHYSVNLYWRSFLIKVCVNSMMMLADIINDLGEANVTVYQSEKGHNVNFQDSLFFTYKCSIFRKDANLPRSGCPGKFTPRSECNNAQRH